MHPLSLNFCLNEILRNSPTFVFQHIRNIYIYNEILSKYIHIMYLYNIILFTYHIITNRHPPCLKCNTRPKNIDTSWLHY